MKSFLISMFLLVLDIGLIATYLNVRLESFKNVNTRKGLVKVLGYIIVILSIVTLISFIKL